MDLYVNGGTDYVCDGVFHLGEGDHSGVLIESVDDLEVLPEGLYPPGALAHTAGWQAAWELSPDGETWAAMIAPADDNSEET